MSVEKIVAENLLSIKAVSLQPTSPFTWASGIKSPIYCDNRLVLSFSRKKKCCCGRFCRRNQSKLQ